MDLNEMIRVDVDPVRYARKIRHAKRKARSDVDPDRWDRHGYSSDRARFWHLPDHVPRVACERLSAERFVACFEEPGIPVVLQGASDHWPANERWTLENLYRDYGDEKFRCGEDDDGYGVYLKLKYFLKYCRETKDDSPLYIFDSSFASRSGTKRLGLEYSPPEYFDEDFFALGGESHRPPYKWIVIGPAGSGTNIHVDPLGTSAWNTLLQGHKRWALFPPHADKLAVEPPGMEDEASSWFMNVYPKTQQSDWPTAPPVLLLQKPGETVFVPSGWWHVVMNLDMTVAVTQNFCSRSNFENVWLKVRSGRPKFCKRIFAQLTKFYPDLAERAIALQTTPYLPDSSSSSSSESDDEECPTTARQSLLSWKHDSTRDSGSDSDGKMKQKRVRLGRDFNSL